MNSGIKKIVVVIIFIGTLIGLGYGASRLYNWVIQDATKKIQSGVTKGISKGLGDAVNPFSWFKKKD